MRLLLPALLLFGCADRGVALLEAEWDVTVEQRAGDPLEVLGFLPPANSDAVAHRVRPYFFFNRPVTTAERAAIPTLNLRQDDGGRDFDLAGEVDFDGAGVRFDDDRLARPGTYRITVELPVEPSPFVIDFVTDDLDVPAFNLADDLEATIFGASPDHAEALTEQFGPDAPVWIAKFGGLGDTLPSNANLVLAVAERRLGESPAFFVHRHYGYITRFDDLAISASGAFSATPDGVFLPLWISGAPILFFLDDVEVRGRISIGAAGVIFEEFSLEGVIGTSWLLGMNELEDSAWGLVLDNLEPDVDTNGNGIDDSATLRIEAVPGPVQAGDIDFG